MAELRFVYPTNGDMLTDAAGRLMEDGSLLIDVAVEADAPATICGKPAEKGESGLWTAQIPLKGHVYEHRLTARVEEEEQEIWICRLKNAAGKYALSVDDNIWWLAELNRDRPESIFDHPYLAIYKRAHEQFGAKVRLNLFYQVEGKAIEKYGDFNLSMMTDQYREEFRANADWLHLAFHSLQEEPGKPYLNASYKEVYEDCKKVHDEIVRFAGKETLEHATTVHFGECSKEGIRALKRNGVWALMGYIALDKNGRPSVSYNLSPEKVLETQRYGFWRDPETGMIYGKIDVVMNLYSPERITEILTEEHEKHPHRGFVEIMIHEQYFHSDYKLYEPDYAERIFAGCRWCHERGYEGAFVEDVIDDKLDLAYIRDALNDRYELTLTTTFALNDGYTDDHEVLCGSNGKAVFQLYDDYGMPVFSIHNAEDTAGTHFHPLDTADALECVEKFMEGKLRYELTPYPKK